MNGLRPRHYIVYVCPTCRRQLFGNTVYCSGVYEERHERVRGVDVVAIAAVDVPEYVFACNPDETGY